MREKKLLVKSSDSADKAFNVDVKKMNKFIDDNSLMDIPPPKAVKKVWESALSDNEVAYLIYTIGTSAGTEGDFEDIDDIAEAEPGEEICKKCGIPESRCICENEKEYIG